MNQKIDNEIGGWTDLDDAPELTQEWFDKAHYYRDGKLVKRGEGEPTLSDYHRKSARATRKAVLYWTGVFALVSVLIMLGDV